LNYRLNNQIKAKEVRVIDEKGEHLGIKKLSEALSMAYEKHLDLIEISPTANPPVARIMNFDKFRYQKEKELKKQILNQKRAENFKQIRISPRMGTSDLKIRVSQISKFLQKGGRVEIKIQTKGRENIHKEFVLKKLNQFLELITIPYKITTPIKKESNGYSVQISQMSKK